jgi:lauroyl/myristoyl acyltransferase
MSALDAARAVEPDEPTTVKEQFAYIAYASVAWVSKRLPTGFGRALFRSLGSLAYRYGPPATRAAVLANQARVIGRPVDDPLVKASAKEAYRRYARYWFDAFAIETWTDGQIIETFEWDGDNYLTEPTDRGQGLIVVSAHLGNWDAAARAMGARALPMVAVAERLRPERLYQLFVRHREAYGIKIVPLAGGGIGRVLANVLAGGNVLALLADRDLTGRGIEVEMFGARRRIPAGPAMLALSTGTSIAVIGTYETPRGWRGIVRPIEMPALTGDRRADARAITQAVADALERTIAASPADWHMFLPAWADDET